MNLSDTKILIPEIPKEWKHRTRSGHTNIWNDSFHRNGLTEIKLDPPIRGLYAERFEDGWYWVCGCSKCLNKNDPYPYIVCDEHNRCETCGIHRDELEGNTAWGVPGGWQCDTCHTKEHDDRKSAAIESARERGHSEDDCYYTDKVICPLCGTENSTDDIHGDEEHELTCFVCDTDFIVTVEYEPRYTSIFKK